MNWNYEVSIALAEWMEHNLTHTPIPANLSAVKEAVEAYQQSPSQDTAGEVLALIHLFTTDPVP